jgi:hypothetical protein
MVRGSSSRIFSMKTTVHQQDTHFRRSRAFLEPRPSAKMAYFQTGDDLAVLMTALREDALSKTVCLPLLGTNGALHT